MCSAYNGAPACRLLCGAFACRDCVVFLAKFHGASCKDREAVVRGSFWGRGSALVRWLRTLSKLVPSLVATAPNSAPSSGCHTFFSLIVVLHPASGPP